MTFRSLEDRTNSPPFYYYNSFIESSLYTLAKYVFGWFLNISDQVFYNKGYKFHLNNTLSLIKSAVFINFMDDTISARKRK